MDTADSIEKNLHEGIAQNTTQATGQTHTVEAIRPVMTQPAVVHEDAKPASHETPFEDFKEDVLGKTVRITDNQGPLSVLKRRVRSLLGNDDKSVA